MFLPQNEEIQLETKSIGSFSFANSFPQFLGNSGNFDLSAWAAIQLYKEAMPFYNAVETRAKHFSMIPIRLFNTATNEFIDSHPVLDLLAAPNADVTQMEFLHSLASYFDITGNVFINATGRITLPPKELIVVSPTLISFGTADKRWGLMNIPTNIQVSNNSVSSILFTNSDVDGSVKFYSGDDQELWKISTFNAGQAIGNFVGTSLATPIFVELQSYMAGNQTNLSSLEKGANISMAWVNNSGSELTPVQYERIKAEAQNYVGPLNAGGTLVLDGMDVTPIGQSNKDMDWLNLMNFMLTKTSNIFDIPLPFLVETSMTLNNLQVSNLQLYDNAVLPLAKRLYKELTELLMHRYPDGDNLELRFNENDIPALRMRNVESAKLQKDIGVNTTNEIRELLGDKPISDGQGGDSILVPSTLLPLDMVGDNENSNQDSSTQQNEPKSAFDDFYNVMSRAVDESGKRIYKESEIVDLALHRGLLSGDQSNTI